MRKAMIILVAATAAACAGKGPKGGSAQQVQSVPAAVVVNPASPETRVQGRLGGISDSRQFTFHAQSGQRVKLSLVAPQAANVRIARVASPSGVSDGPFGREAEYPIAEDGAWVVEIGENRMASEGYEGDFTLVISLFAPEAR